MTTAKGRSGHCSRRAPCQSLADIVVGVEPHARRQSWRKASWFLSVACTNAHSLPATCLPRLTAWKYSAAASMCVLGFTPPGSLTAAHRDACFTASRR